MKLLKRLSVLAVAAALPLTADAHRAWMLPSSTVLSGDAPWVTVDAAAANGIFYFDHFPMMLEGVGAPAAGSKRQPPYPHCQAQRQQHSPSTASRSICWRFCRCAWQCG